MKNGRARFFSIKDLDSRANLCENYVYPGTIKNDKGDVTMRNFLCNINGTNNSIKLK